MARGVSRGEIWLHRFDPPDKRRPVLVLSRAAAIPLLDTVIVAPITSTIRGLPTEVPLGVEHGLKGPCVANLDHVQLVRKQHLERHVGTVDAEVLRAACRALAIATGCG